MAKSFTLIAVLVIVTTVLLSGLFALRFGLGGDEDTWICEDGLWVAHGKPSEQKPTTGCGEIVLDDTQVFVYYPNSTNSDETDCTEVFGVSRKVASDATEKDILDLLFAGPTSEERQEGYSSFFTQDTKDLVKSVRIVNQTAYVDMKDIRQLIPNASSSCGSVSFRSQIEKTLKGARDLDFVIYAIEGNPETFYEWIQTGCTYENNNCDSLPFESF